MTTRSRPFVRLAALAAVAACSNGGPIGPDHSDPLADRPAAAARNPERPSGGRCETSVSFLPPEPGQPPNVQRLQIALDCRLRHLGRTTGTAEQTVTFTSPTTALVANTTVYTAANGDQLVSTFSRTAAFPAPGEVTFEGIERYLGGTGRFADAAGSAQLAGSASLVALTGVYETTGTIRY